MSSPLTQKLKDCGVFGVSSDEYLDYALQNRKEWSKKGRQVVAEMSVRLAKEFKEEEQRTKDRCIPEETEGDFLDDSHRNTQKLLGISN